MGDKIEDKKEEKDSASPSATSGGEVESRRELGVCRAARIARELAVPIVTRRKRLSPAPTFNRSDSHLKSVVLRGGSSV